MPRTIRYAAVAAAVLAATFTAVSRAADPQVTATASPVQPRIITSALKGLYFASWTNNSKNVLTNTVITIFLPPGSRVLVSEPDVCTVAYPTLATDPVVVTCPRDSLRRGATFTQLVLFRAPTVTEERIDVVTAQLTANEAAHDGTLGPAHLDTFSPPPERVTFVRTDDPSRGGSCLQDGDAGLSTESSLTSPEQITTTITPTGPIPYLCAPAQMSERARSTGHSLCATCTTDISTTEASVLPDPYQLTFTFPANNRRILWFKNGVLVAECFGATALPAGQSACVNGIDRVPGGMIRVSVLWAGGPDPEWEGAVG